MFDEDGGGLWALGELYVQAKAGPLQTRLFRQEINAPFLNRHDIRMLPNTFEAYDLAGEFPNKGIKIAGGHTTRIKLRESTGFIPMSEPTGALGTSRGVTSLGGRLDFGDKEAHVGAVDHYGWDTLNIFYVEAEWKRTLDETSGFAWTTSAQFIDQRDTGDALAGEFDTQAIGWQVAAGVGSLIGTTAITRVFGDSDIRKPWGGTPSYNSMIIGDFDAGDEKALRFGVSFDFADVGIEGVSAFANYIHGWGADYGGEKEWNATLDYRPTKGALENLWLRVRYASNERPTRTLRDFRVILK